jgi:hypothetical protein
LHDPQDDGQDFDQGQHVLSFPQVARMPMCFWRDFKFMPPSEASKATPQEKPPHRRGRTGNGSVADLAHEMEQVPLVLSHELLFVCGAAYFRKVVF